MRTATELSLFLENKPGTLAALLADLKKHHVNLEAISVVDHTDHALVRLVVADRKRALDVLEGAGLLVIDAEVLRIEASNRPGALGEVCARLAKAKINIQYLYGSVGISTRACLFLRVSDPKRAQRLLER
ncbi:MAG: ACT domain-containing protein [Deltaproteobacteria bacterium]|nr:ACT domain-containing protein [Deltaproteobacteria bacterium]